MLSVLAVPTIQWPAARRNARPDSLTPRRSDTLEPMRTGAAQVDLGPDPSDAVLIARFAVRDEAALSELFDRYSSAAHGLALFILKESSLAQEIVHDSFLKVWEKPQLFDPSRAAFSTFILTVVRHAAISKLRGVRYTVPLEDEEGFPLPLADERVDLLSATEQRQVTARVRAVLDTLKPAQRETVERAYYRGETREEIAAVMGVPVGTVKSRLKYALEKMRGLLDEDGWNDTDENDTEEYVHPQGEVKER